MLARWDAGSGGTFALFAEFPGRSGLGEDERVVLDSDSPTPVQIGRAHV